MSTVLFNPNPYDSSVTIGGGAKSGDDPYGDTYYVEAERTNYREIGTSPTYWDVVYSGGWNPKYGKIEATFNRQDIIRIAAYIDGTSEMEDLEYDGSALWGIHYTVEGINAQGNISNIQFGSWRDGSYVVTTKNQDGTSTSQTTETTSIYLNQAEMPGNALNNIAPRCVGSFNTNIPLFLTRDQAFEFLRTGDNTGQLNGASVVQPDEYDYYIYNRVSSTVGSGFDYTGFYRFKMNPNERLCFYKSVSESDKMFDRTLLGYDGAEIIYKGDSEYQDVMPQIFVLDHDRFLGEQIKWNTGTTYTPVTYNTNIPTFDTLEHARNYIATGDETGIIDKWRESGVVDPSIGDPTDETPQGENGMVLTFGGGMYRMTNAQLASFYGEVFDNDPSIIQAILDGLQLFGSNQINAITGVTYYPFPISNVATLASGSDIYLGAYKITRTTGDRVQKNDKLINMGSQYFAPPYGDRDFRNYEPYCKLYIMLPYAGVHELQISKYIGKYVTIKMAVDLATGQATYFLYAGQTIMDSFDCCIGAHRPITASDHARHVSDTVNAVLQTGQGALQSVVQGATENLATFGSAANTVLQGYQAMNITNDPPMSTRGSFTGGTGLFDVKSPYFIFAQQKPQAPANLLQIMGKPSSAGGRVSNFSGFLSTCAFSLADGFTGTQEEAEEIYSLMAGGVYVD